MDSELRSYLDTQFRQVNGRLDSMSGKLDETTEKTILNTQAIAYAREEISNARAAQCQCMEDCNGHRKDIRDFVTDKARSISREGDLTQRIWLLSLTIMILFAIFKDSITGAFK